MRRARLVVLLGLLLPSCGGGGGSPTTPSTPTPPPPVTNSIQSSRPPSATVDVTECGGDCTSAVKITYTVTSNQSVTGAELYTQLFDGSGRQCVSNSLLPARSLSVRLFNS
jgi:hypothetical protein